MKNVFAFLLLLALLGSAVPVQAQAESNVLECSVSPKPCNFLKSGDIKALEFLALYADKDPVHMYTKYADDWWGPVFTTYLNRHNTAPSLYGIREDMIPDEIKFSTSDYVGIPEMGVLYQNQNFITYEPKWVVGIEAFETFPDGMAVGSSQFDQPKSHSLAELLLSDERQRTYYKASPNLTLIFYWDLEMDLETSQITILIREVTVQARRPELGLWQYYYNPLPEGTDVLTASEVADLAVSLDRGDTVQVGDVYTSTLMRIEKPWSILFDVVDYVELEVGNTSHIVSVNDVSFSYVLSCSDSPKYFPIRGETLWVNGTLDGLELSRDPSYRILKEEEANYMVDLLNTSAVRQVEGKVYNEFRDGSQFYFTFEANNGEVITINSFEYQTPSVGSKVTAYLDKDDNLLGLATTAGFWKLHLDNANWTAKYTCPW